MQFSMKSQTALLIFVSFLFGIGGVSAGAFSRVVIDPGHGDQDVGGNVDRVYEKHLALDTALRLEYFLSKKGIRTTMTRKSDIFISLAKRASIGNRYDNSIFVSIHYNWAWRKDASGIETFYYSSRSKPLAQYIQNGIMRKTKAVNRGVKHASYYVIRHLNNPAVLVECGFVSNSRERANMKKGYWRQNVVEGIGNGILEYQAKRKSGDLE
jgi:N-acetylmuramoyl-L-alanine amidase